MRVLIIKNLGLCAGVLLLTMMWLFLATPPAHAQDIEWVNPIRKNDDDAAIERDFALDSANNLYVVGSFLGNTTFESTTASDMSSSKVFLTKYDAAGNVLRVQQFSGTDWVDARGIAIDDADNVYLVGIFRGQVNIGGTDLATPGQQVALFVAKLDPDGNALWITQINTVTGTASGDHISLDTAGSIYIAGTLSHALDFGTEVLTSQGSQDVFVAKFDNQGDFIWAEQIGSNAWDNIGGIATHAGNLYITGRIDGVTTIGSTTLTPTGGTGPDIFLAAYDPNGTVLWARNDGGADGDYPANLVIDTSGNLYIAGQFENQANFGPLTVQSVRTQDGFIAKYDNLGTPLWVQTFGGRERDYATDIAIDDADNVYISGWLNDGDGTVGNTQINGLGFFVASYDPAGHFIWARQVTTLRYVIGSKLAIAPTGHINVIGFYLNDVRFWPLTVLGHTGYPYRFLARWRPSTLPDQIFSDGFEGGDFTAWTNYSSDLGDLTVTGDAALVGDLGLQAQLDDNTTIGMREELPIQESRYRARFYFDPNDLAMAHDESHVIFFGYSGSDLRRPVLRVELRYHTSDYQVRVALFDDATTWRTSLWHTITNEAHLIELDWHAAIGDGANNGSVALLVDGVRRALVGQVDNDTRRIDTVRLGAIAGIDDNTRGTYYFDAFASQRHTYIGPASTATTAIATPVTITDPATVTTWEEVDQSDPAEAALMQEVLNYAAKVEREEGQQQATPLFLPYVDNQ